MPDVQNTDHPAAAGHGGVLHQPLDINGSPLPWGPLNPYRWMHVVGPMRSHYGPILGSEPSMLFSADGHCTVTGGGQTHHLTPEQVEAFNA